MYQLSWQSETVLEIERPETCEFVARHSRNPFNRDVWRCANALLEFGLPETSRIGALALFNLGVEAGQVLFVGIVLVVFLVIRKAVEIPHLRPAVGYTVGVTAMFWTLERLM